MEDRRKSKLSENNLEDSIISTGSITKETRNLLFVINNYPVLSRYSWEIDGERVYYTNIVNQS
jgi:hypothetical protein